ncbi:MAG: DM13 domain-containing protein, partial [Dehalococcoidia bacterium]|nr:DM13 domain-containing protein [Dehalococcoidia bacterium]
VSESVAGGALRAIAVGSFVNGRQPYQTSGRAIIGETADGGRIVRLEGFRTTNGPDLYVYLSTSATPNASDQIGRFVDLGRLRGNVGDQNYPIARDVDLAQYRSVVIYCRAFARVFGYATITAP